MHTLSFSVVPGRPGSGVRTPVEMQTGGEARVEETLGPQTPHMALQLGKYEIRLAETLAEREAACRLRFRVFNIELGEGLESSYQTGLDQDHFDLFCDHLIVEDRFRREVVGTYRMQSGGTAAENLGYYSEQEFQNRRAPTPRAGGRDAKKDEERSAPGSVVRVSLPAKGPESGYRLNRGLALDFTSVHRRRFWQRQGRCARDTRAWCGPA